MMQQYLSSFFFQFYSYWPQPYCVRLDRGAKQSMEGHNTYVKHCRTAKSTTEVARQSMFCFTLCWLEVVLDLEQNKVIYIQSTIKTQINLVFSCFCANWTNRTENVCSIAKVCYAHLKFLFFMGKRITNLESFYITASTINN